MKERKKIEKKKFFCIFLNFLIIFLFFLLFSLSELFAFILPQENFSLPPSFSFKPADYPLFNQLRFFLAADNLPEFFQTPLTNYEVLDKVSKEIINYFMGKGTRDEPGLRDENSGLFVDFGSAKDPTVDLSIAATGYGLTALVIAAEYGLIDKGTGEAWVVKALTTIKEMQDVALNYEKDLIDYLLTEGVKKLPYPDPATYSILYRLGKKGWERFLALEELRDRFEVDFLKEKKGYKLAYLQEEIDYKREKGLSRELDPNERAEVNLRFLRKYSEIFKLGRFGLLYRYLNRVKPEPPDGKIPLPSRSIKEGLNDLSTVDTGILLMGVLTAGRYFGGKAWELAQGIYENVNWQMMINNPGNTGIGAGEHPEVISHGWTPEGVPGHPHASQKGFLEGRWDIYTDETLLLVLLAMGKPKSPSASYNSYKALLDLEPKELGKELYDKFEKNRAEVGGMPPAILSVQGGLWTYHMVNVWLDTQNRFDAQNKVNWYQNAVKATLANRNIVLKMKDNEGKTLAERYKTFDEHLWPITTMLTPLADIPGKSQGGYRMDIGVVKPTISPEKLREIPPLVAPNGYGGSIIHSLFSYLGMRYLASTEREIWTKGGFVDAFSYDMGTGGRPGEWFAGTQVAFSQGQFLQLFNLLGEMDKDKKSLWEITQNIPYFEKAFEKAGLKQLSEAPLLPEEISGEMRQEVRQRIEDLDKIIQGGNNQSILGMFIGIINHYLTKEGAREGEFKSLIELLKKRIAEKPDNPLLNYLFAETRMAQIRNISRAATGEKYVKEGDHYKTLEAIKYYFQNADDYYQEAKDYLRRALANISRADSLREFLEIRATALDFILTKNTFSSYPGQKELFKELARLLHSAQNPWGGSKEKMVSEIAQMLYRYDYEAELSGALSLERIFQDLLYWETNYDFGKIRTPIYPRLER